MAISNTSSGFRPGVCTSTTRPEAPFNGQVIYETDTKQTLVWQGTAWVMLTDADQPPGLQLVKSQAVGTGVSSVTVTDAFSADYANYRIIVEGGTQSAVSPVVSFQLASGGVASTANYYATFIFTAYSGSTFNALNTNNGINWPYVAMSLNDGLSGAFDVYQTII